MLWRQLKNERTSRRRRRALPARTSHHLQVFFTPLFEKLLVQILSPLWTELASIIIIVDFSHRQMWTYTIALWLCDGKKIFHLFCEPVNSHFCSEDKSSIHQPVDILCDILRASDEKTLRRSSTVFSLSQWAAGLLTPKANGVLACSFCFMLSCFLSDERSCLLFQYLIFCTLCLLTTLVYVDYLHDSEQNRLLLSTEPFALTE